MIKKIFYRIQSVKLNYLHYDNNKQMNLIVQHGLMGSSKNFRNICKNTNISSYANCYLVDARNHGDSPHTQTHRMQELASDLARFIQQKKLKNVILLGHSMGGTAVLAFSKIFPNLQNIVKQLIIVDISNSKSQVIDNQLKNMISNLASINMEQSRQKIYEQIKNYCKTPEVIGLIKSNLIQTDGKIQWKVNIKVLAREYELFTKYKIDNTNWTNPVSVIYGSNSPYINQQQALQYKNIFQNFTVSDIYRIQGSGHWVHFEKPFLFLDSMKTILTKSKQ